MKENPNVEVVIISLDDDQADAKAFLKQHGMNLPANMANMRDMSALAVRGLPASIVIDRNSNVAARYMGDLQWLDASVSAKVLLWF